jgi:WD40 repeat protein
VNTVTFVDEGRRFVSTSDDKTIRVWEFGIPVQIKYIADPGLHSIPAVAVHPNAQWWIGTSLDNQIVTYAARDRFRQNRKKVFKVRGGCRGLAGLILRAFLGFKALYPDVRRARPQRLLGLLINVVLHWH